MNIEVGLRLAFGFLFIGAHRVLARSYGSSVYRAVYCRVLRDLDRFNSARMSWDLTESGGNEIAYLTN
jgi:hypothetical protein